MAAPAAASAAGRIASDSLSETIELRLSARDLPKLDTYSNTDPFAVLFAKEGETWAEVGRTEKIMDNQAPEWVAAFPIEFHFEVEQKFKVSVFDGDHNRPTLEGHDTAGSAEFKLADLMCSPTQSVTLPLEGCSRRGFLPGTLVVRGEAVSTTRDELRVQFQAISKLANKDGLIGRSDPFLTISRLREDGEWQRVHKSETKDNDLKPTWNPMVLSMQALCNNDLDRPLRFEVWDEDSGGRSEAMGKFDASVRQLLEPNAQFEVIEDDKKAKKRNYTHSGIIKPRTIELVHRPLFTDYLKAGYNIQMMVAIDFTGSNGDPARPDSLHYISPAGTPNDYETALATVGNIVLDYDSDKLVWVGGFGARVGGHVSHCFSVYPEGTGAPGVEGVVQAYKACLQNVQLAGPTLLAPLLDAVKAKAAASPPNTYTVLLLLADGAFNDMPQTIDQLVAAADVPLSVIIVGIGGADFHDFELLDGDGGHLRSSRGQVASRDIVQHVSMRDYSRHEHSRLAADVLRELPGQFLAYYESRGIMPGRA